MNTLVIVLIAAVCLFGAYMLYGRWLANKWGIDPSAKTPLSSNAWPFCPRYGAAYVCTLGVAALCSKRSGIAEYSIHDVQCM